MSRSLSWEYLSPYHLTRLAQVPAGDVASFRQILLDADQQTKAGYFTNLSEAHTQILLDFFYHLLRFSRAQAMTPEKQSTLVSIAYRTHRDSMERRLSISDSFALLEQYLIAHSVHRPPYSAAVFAVDDTKMIVDYLLSTYYRHYKLYLYAFSLRSVAQVTSQLLGDVAERLPTVPPLAKGVPLAQWEATQAELRKKELEKQKKQEEEELALIREEQRKRALEAQGPPMPSGLRAQLDTIRSQIGKQSAERLDDLESRLIMLESRLAQDAAKPASSGPAGAAGGKPAGGRAPAAGGRK